MRMAHRHLQHLLRCLSLLCLLLAGCGYTVVGATADTATARIVLAVPPAANHSREPGMATHITAALRQVFVQRQTFALAPATVAAHVLHSVVERVQITPVSFDKRDNAVQYRIEAHMRFWLVADTVQRLLVNQKISAWAEYLVRTTSGAIRENAVAREAALHQVAQQLAEKCAALLEVILF